MLYISITCVSAHKFMKHIYSFNIQRNKCNEEQKKGLKKCDTGYILSNHKLRLESSIRAQTQWDVSFSLGVDQLQVDSLHGGQDRRVGMERGLRTDKWRRKRSGDRKREEEETKRDGWREAERQTETGGEKEAPG